MNVNNIWANCLLLAVLQATQSIQNRTRQSTGAAYLEVNIARNNLHVLTNSLVTRILFDSSTGTPTAFGVQFVRQNKTYKVNATREVIISGGTNCNSVHQR